MHASCSVIFTEAIISRFSRFRLRDDNFFHLDSLRPRIALYYAHTPDSVILDIFVEVADFFALLHEDSLVRLGLLGTGCVVGSDIFKAVDIHIALVDEHISYFALFVGEIVSLDLIVIRCEQLNGLYLAKPPILSGYPAI